MGALWGRWVPVSRWRNLIDYAIGRLGLTEVDVRDARIAYNYDLLQVRLWNRRRLTVTGYEMAAYRGRP